MTPIPDVMPNQNRVVEMRVQATPTVKGFMEALEEHWTDLCDAFELLGTLADGEDPTGVYFHNWAKEALIFVQQRITTAEGFAWAKRTPNTDLEEVCFLIMWDPAQARKIRIDTFDTMKELEAWVRIIHHELSPSDIYGTRMVYPECYE